MEESTKNSAGLKESPVALVAPLDWGLGHATRCIPLVKRLSGQGFRVVIAAEGAQKTILQQEFPGLRFADLPGYRLRYGRSGWQTTFRIFLQIPKILISINREQRWLKRFLEANKVDLVVSDNRYGFRDSSVRSVFITHQLYIKTPFGSLAERWLQRMNYGFIEKFDECWVPDHEREENLAGILSHPGRMPAIPLRYLGPLTRCYKKDIPVKNELLILLSGPEPQRTLLEDILLRELKEYHEPVLFVRGLPAKPCRNSGAGYSGDPAETSIESFNGVTVYNHLPSEELNEAMNASRLLIARSGYSTVMDAMQLDKQCIFIPTPGQSEQLYLAEYLSAKKRCVFFEQHDFSLRKALNAAAGIDIIN
ncbi:MAG TPA: glycosyltransferase [Chitinophagaceae bacterium]|nr:glycosyltransferase [Chitinophagaceae bacterium]